jgi:hypothetical protein
MNLNKTINIKRCRSNRRKCRRGTTNRITCIFAVLPGYISPGLQLNESVMVSASVCLLRADRIRYRGGGVNESHARGKFKSLKMASEIRKIISSNWVTFLNLSLL